jgi:hypothetical protein
MPYEHTYRRTPEEYHRRVSEAMAVAGGGVLAHWDERFLAALERRDLCIAMRKHPMMHDDWLPEAGPYRAPAAYSKTWPEDAVVVWKLTWHR